MAAQSCDICSSPVFNSKDMGGYISNLCERHYFKVLDMMADGLEGEY